MEAPPGGMSAQEFFDFQKKFIETHYDKKEDGWVCKKCGSEVQQTTCYVSKHTTLFSGCAGSGRVKTVPLPYCPKCEGEPKKVNTCTHDVLDD